MIDILSKRYVYFLVSVLVIIPGLIVLFTGGLPLSIDFTGGSLLEVQLSAGQTLSTETMQNIYENAGIDDAQIPNHGKWHPADSILFFNQRKSRCRSFQYEIGNRR